MSETVRRHLIGRREALVTLGAGVGDLHLLRRNIRGGRPGTPLALKLKVVDATTCKPIRNATVDIWHADAGGVYSGVSGNSGNFLRGIQPSSNSADGIYRQAGARSILPLRRKGSSVASGYSGTLPLGVER